MSLAQNPALAEILDMVPPDGSLPSNWAAGIAELHPTPPMPPVSMYRYDNDSLHRLQRLAIDSPTIRQEAQSNLLSLSRPTNARRRPSVRRPQNDHHRPPDITTPRVVSTRDSPAQRAVPVSTKASQAKRAVIVRSSPAKRLPAKRLPAISAMREPTTTATRFETEIIMINKLPIAFELLAPFEQSIDTAQLFETPSHFEMLSLYVSLYEML